MGWTPPEEVRWVARLVRPRLGPRATRSVTAARRRPQALRAFQQTLIEIAFLHNRVRRRTAPRDVNARMAACSTGPRRSGRTSSSRPSCADGYGGPALGAPPVPATVPAWCRPGCPSGTGPAPAPVDPPVPVGPDRAGDPRVLRRAGRRTNLGLLPARRQLRHRVARLRHRRTGVRPGRRRRPRRARARSRRARAVEGRGRRAARHAAPRRASPSPSSSWSASSPASSRCSSVPGVGAAADPDPGPRGCRRRHRRVRGRARRRHWRAASRRPTDLGRRRLLRTRPSARVRGSRSWPWRRSAR